MQSGKTNKHTQHVLLLSTRQKGQERGKIKKRLYEFLDQRALTKCYGVFACAGLSFGLWDTPCSMMQHEAIEKDFETSTHHCKTAQQYNPESCQILFMYNGKNMAALCWNCSLSNIVPVVCTEKNGKEMQTREISSRGKSKSLRISLKNCEQSTSELTNLSKIHKVSFGFLHIHISDIWIVKGYWMSNRNINKRLKKKKSLDLEAALRCCQEFVSKRTLFKGQAVTHLYNNEAMPHVNG